MYDNRPLPFFTRPRLQVESTHATPRPEEKVADVQDQPHAATGTGPDGVNSHDVRVGGGGNGMVGTAAAGVGGGGGRGKDEKGGVKVQHRRRRSTGLDGGGRNNAQRGGGGYPMSAVAAVLRQLHMRVLSGEEMKMLDQVTGETRLSGGGALYSLGCQMSCSGGLISLVFWSTARELATGLTVTMSLTGSGAAGGRLCLPCFVRSRQHHKGGVPRSGVATLPLPLKEAWWVVSMCCVASGAGDPLVLLTGGMS